VLREDDRPMSRGCCRMTTRGEGIRLPVRSPTAAAIPAVRFRQFSPASGIGATANGKGAHQKQGTWWERFTGADDCIATGLRVPNSPRRHCERSEAIHLAAQGKMECSLRSQ